MTQRRVAHRNGTHSLVWLLLLAIALMGLTVSRQQMMGSLHIHADGETRGPSSLSTVAAGLASDWLNRWRQQQLFGHGELGTRIAPDATLRPLHTPQASELIVARGARDHGHDHDHASLERHHHAASDTSVVAVDGAAAAADTADGAAGGTLMVLPIVAMTSSALVVPAVDGKRGAWPVGSAATYISWNVAPPLRPPAV